MNWLHYLLQVNLYMILFYGFYHFLLRKETFFHLNRAYLLAAAALSFFIPSIQLESLKDWFVTEQVYQTISVIYDPSVYYDKSEAFSLPTWNIGDLISFAYIIGVLVGVGRLGLQMAYLGNLLRDKNHKGIKSAFSFFNFLFVSKDLKMRDVIVEHEYVHIRQIHSADVLFFELIAIFNWFNPVVFLYKKSIRHIHEFIADEIASRRKLSKEEYAMLLFNEQFGVNMIPLTNNFFNESLLKIRVKMLLQERSDDKSMLKYGLVIPLFLLMVVMSSATVIETEQLSQELDRITEKRTDEATSPEPKNTGSQVISEAEIDISQASIISPALAQELKQEKEKVFFAVERQPLFKGGMPMFVKYLQKNLKYPPSAVRANISGKVYVQFTVNQDGGTEDYGILKGVGFGLDEEAIRVLKSAPKWIPGVHKGKTVRCRFTVPINFVLS
ncbi:M56 family metallopeptidase [Flectobacillus major]|uniref:M56 family metallopeptidase n=1 Tax=Flectobacillus major TaxID=103 RepID=UPI0009DBA239|nr:M56 family metallopeptidase [Flectobacillus major]